MRETGTQRKHQDSERAEGERGDRELAIARAFITLTDTLIDDYDVLDLLDRLMTYSVELLAADAAGLRWPAPPAICA